MSYRSYSLISYLQFIDCMHWCTSLLSSIRTLELISIVSDPLLPRYLTFSLNMNLKITKFVIQKKEENLQAYGAQKKRFQFFVWLSCFSLKITYFWKKQLKFFDAISQFYDKFSKGSETIMLNMCNMQK